MEKYIFIYFYHEKKALAEESPARRWRNDEAILRTECEILEVLPEISSS